MLVLLAQFHQDRYFDKGIQQVKDHAAEYAAFIHQFTCHTNINKGSHQANYHFRHNTPIHRANNGMRIFVMHGTGVQVKGDRGSQEQDQITNDQNIGIDIPPVEHRPETKK
jgi:hypothetical protein